ncbi:O-antigen ligase family protein, partial [Candidatus Kaiserbacteria bacterium]|nr:O-antigen ligase family protein [Candidatus Kaiserbacteria bacterium]
LYGSVIALDTLALFFTGTRGTMLGLIGGAILAVFIFALVHGSRRARMIALTSVVAVVILGGGLWFARDTAFVRSVGFLDRLASISLTDSTIKARFLNMGIAWQGVKERPILGWGQENYAIVFDKYYDPRMYGQEPWFDRVHDIIFDWWIAGGTLGLLAYLSIFAMLLWAIWRPSVAQGSTEASTPNVRKDASSEGVFTDAEKVILTGLLAGYFVHNLTVFDNITSYILFATLLGYIAWREGEARHEKYVVETELLPRSNLPFVAVAAALAVWGVAWWVNAGALAQNRALIQAIQPQSAGVPANIEYFKKALSYGSFGTQETREQLAQIASQVASAKDVDIPTKQQIFELAVTEMMAQEKASPMDARSPLFLGVVFGSYGDYADAATALSHARDLSPRKQSLFFAIAQNQQQQGDQAGALQTLKEAYELDTDVTDARMYYASALIVAGKDALADELLAPLIPTGEAADTRIAAAYVTRGRFDKIAAIWEAKVKASPTDQQAYLTLAAAYYEAGNTAKAIAVLRDAEAAFPSQKDQAEKLIQEIQNGTAKVGGN